MILDGNERLKRTGEEIMKILILGSIGMAGHAITLYFKEKGYDVTAYSFLPSPIVKILSETLLKQTVFKACCWTAIMML